MNKREVEQLSEVYFGGRKIFEDAMLDRAVCSRRVLIEKDHPRYAGNVKLDYIPSDFITSMGSIILVGEIINKAININKNKKAEKDVRNSLWEIAKFTASNFFSGKK